MSGNLSAETYHDPLVRAIRVLMFGRSEYWGEAADALFYHLRPQAKPACVCGAQRVYRDGLCAPCFICVTRNPRSWIRRQR